MQRQGKDDKTIYFAAEDGKVKYKSENMGLVVAYAKAWREATGVELKLFPVTVPRNNVQ